MAKRDAIAQALAAYLLAMSGGAVAQSPAPDPTGPKTTANSAELPTVVITGTKGIDGSLQQPSTAGSRLNLSPLETPARVAVVPGERIRALGVTRC